MTGTSNDYPAPALTQRPHRANESIRLALGALGVVYGDIGTSPLYAVRECFFGEYGTAVNHDNILGVLSLLVWALILIVVVKYLTFVMRADNRGEGGILALLALLLETPSASPSAARRKVLVMLALFASALLFADGMITPAISVLSAVEGLRVATPVLHNAVVPVTVMILVALFLVQRHGTANIARLAGPMMLVWFSTLALLGIGWIIREPGVLAAVNPYHVFRMVLFKPGETFLLLGAVLLVVTGAEALYADMGHFGRGPIRLAWYTVVFPALLLNYFGQGALLMHGGEREVNTFYAMAPQWFLYPLVGIATLATIIASQAMISGTFSLAQQAVQLGYTPRLSIIHTSSKVAGQIYVPQANTMLMIGCLGLVLGFKTSSNLAAAYGIAVMGAMTITSILIFAVSWERWRWPLWVSLGVTALFLAVDLPFLLSNLNKFGTGGWVPVVVGLTIFTFMTTWHRGKAILNRPMYSIALPMSVFLRDVEKQKPLRVSGTAVFMTGRAEVIPHALLHHYKHNQVLHERVILLSVQTQPVPKVAEDERIALHEAGHGFYTMTVSYGFMEDPDVPVALRLAARHGMEVDPQQVSYYLGRVSLIVSGVSGMSRWRLRLFELLYRNEQPATAFFNLPANRVVELGRHLEI